MLTFCLQTALLLQPTSTQNTTDTPLSRTTSHNASILTTNMYTTDTICATDTSGNPDNTCLDFYRWGLCEEEWMKGKCCKTCGYSSCLDICYNNDIKQIPSEYYPNPFNCSSDFAPNDIATCQQRNEWGNCGSGWMYGFCCSSCPESCNCDIQNYNITTTEIVYESGPSNCNEDIAPDNDATCFEQYRWRNCDKPWMNGYCCLTCGYTSCLDTCYDGSIENIPISKYYPNPFDCQSNINDPGTCIDERKWGNCDQDWMFGWCCLSCPQACNCLNYSWGNNTEYINYRPEVIVTMSEEEIIFWERFYIAIHCILLLFILIIPIMICVEKYIDKKVQLKIKEIDEMTEPKSPIGNNTSTAKSQSVSLSRWRKRTQDESVEKSKVYKFYVILAFICILLWSYKTMNEAISIIIWDHDQDLAESIAIWWDIFRMTIYVISKMLMYISFIARIYFSFKNSAYAYSIYVIISLVVVLIIDTLLKIICFTTYIYKLSGNVIDRDLSHSKGWIYYVLIFLVIEELIYTVVLIAAFVKPLIMISTNSNHVSPEILHMISKYIVLGLFCILSSSIMSIIKIFVISTHSLFIIWTTSAFESIDCVINAWSTILLFKMTDLWYKKICKPCNHIVQLIYIKKFKQQGIEMINNL